MTLKRAKAIHGKLTLPPSPDLFCIAAFTALASGRPVHIHPVGQSAQVRRWADLLAGHAEMSIDNDRCTIDPAKGNTAADIILPDETLPYRDLIVFLALGTHKRVLFRSVGEARLLSWQAQATRLGFGMEIVQESGMSGLVLKALSSSTPLPAMVEERDIQPGLGLLFALKAKRSFRIGFNLSNAFRHLCSLFGQPIEVKRDIGETEKDPLLRRMRLKAGQRLSSQDQTFLVTADFSTPPESPSMVDLLLPGDEVMLALFCAAKSLVQKDSLVIDNVPLESWASPMLGLLRKMGCKASVQELQRTAFGSSGMISLPKYEVKGQKTDFIAQHHSAYQLPSMAIAAAFAEGQSLFRQFDDLRLNDPDSIRQLEFCLKTMGVKFGDIPDGLVIQGAEEYDGFDLIEPLPAHLGAAFAVAGLRCVGSTTIYDEHILERWPDFYETVMNVCEFRN